MNQQEAAHWAESQDVVKVRAIRSGEEDKANDWKTIDNLRRYWQNYGKEVMGDNPVAWNAMKERRKEEKQRKAIAEANSSTRYIFRAKKRRIDKKTLEIRFFIHRAIL